MHPQFRISARRRGRRAVLAVVVALCLAIAASIVWVPVVPVSASAVSAAWAGAVQMRRSHACELSIRAASGAALIIAAAWWLLMAATGRADWQTACIACAIAASSGWLVWVPHEHPALVRASTGFADLDAPDDSGIGAR